MNTRPATVSFVVKVDGRVAFRDLTIDWIESDDAQTIANDIKDAILNIE
jgi:hypothetical protein